jgi:hypothetical protein
VFRRNITAVFRSKLTPLNIAIAGIGVVLLVVTVQRVGGWSAVVTGIASVGWWFIPVLILGAARMGCRAAAWIACVRQYGDRLRWRDGFAAMLAGDAAGNLTPLGVLASEPTKILLTRSRTSTVASVASVAIENAFYIASVAIVLLTGTWIFLQRADVPASLEHISEGIVIIVVIVGVIALWVARTRPAVLSRFAPVMLKLARRADVPADGVAEIESRIYGVLRWPLRRILGVVVWEALFHILAVAEVWMVLRLLPGSASISLADAFLMESAGRFVTIAFKFVPYRLGIDEAGSGAVSTVLGLGAATGVTLALVRRLRIIVLNAFGLLKLVDLR